MPAVNDVLRVALIVGIRTIGGPTSYTSNGHAGDANGQSNGHPCTHGRQTGTSNGMRCLDCGEALR